MTSRRVNALDTVVIPRIAGFVDYIVSELDEAPTSPPLLPQLEREEFFRLKRSQDKKKKDLQLAEAERLKEIAADDAGSLIGGGDDPDVIY